MTTPYDIYFAIKDIPVHQIVEYKSLSEFPSIGIYAHTVKNPKSEAANMEIGALTVGLQPADAKKSLAVIGTYSKETDIFTAHALKFPDGKIKTLEEPIIASLGANYDYGTINKIANIAVEQADLHLKNKAALVLAANQKKSEPVPKNKHKDEQGVFASLVQNLHDFNLGNIFPSLEASIATTSLPINTTKNNSVERH